MVLLAISAYREIPDTSVKKVFVQPLNELPNPSLPYPSSIAKYEAAKVSVRSENKPSSPNIYSEISTPPPPPPPSTFSQKISEEPANITTGEVDNADETPFVVVEEMPMFPGGDVELLKFIGTNTVYPEVAKANNIQGRVIVRFCVTSTGGVSKTSILKGVSPELDAEAIRVVNTLPQFKPGKQDGKAVPVWYMVPITFNLK
jgi:protein TonB